MLSFRCNTTDLKKNGKNIKKHLKKYQSRKGRTGIFIYLGLKMQPGQWLLSLSVGVDQVVIPLSDQWGQKEQMLKVLN